MNQYLCLRWHSFPSPMNPSLQMHRYWAGPMYSHFAFLLHGRFPLSIISLFSSVSLIWCSFIPDSDVLVALNPMHKLIGKHFKRPCEVSALKPCLQSPWIKTIAKIYGQQSLEYTIEYIHNWYHHTKKLTFIWTYCIDANRIRLCAKMTRLISLMSNMVTFIMIYGLE